MAKPSAAVFCMPEEGHFKLLRPLISDLVRSGFTVHVLTHRHFAQEVARAGANLIDLFGAYPLERADSESIPIPCRYVSYAALYAEEVVEELRRIGLDLIVYETFAVIGRLAAQRLCIPFINVSPGHNMDPARHVAALKDDPRVAVSERCHRAADTLRERYGLSDASPFSYITGLSPYLNIIGEPPEFLTEDERGVFEPLAFYGCILPREDAGEEPCTEDSACFGEAGRYRLYVSFGTVIMQYYAETAIGAFAAVSECLATMPEACALVSLGRAPLDENILRRLSRPNVTFVRYADQRRALQRADAFVTHHGINSTHEAILHRVPMLSYPFFSDQPTLAARCQEFGLALPLAGAPREPVTAEHVKDGLARIMQNREELGANLDRARGWELEVMAERPAVLRRIEDLI